MKKLKEYKGKEEKYDKKLNEKILKNKKGITLIALVITIIIMLILAGVAIKTLTGKEGLIARAMQVKQRTEYQIAKEEVDTKLMEIVASCEERGVEYNIDEIYEAIEKDDEKTIEKIFNKGTGAVKSGVKDTIIDLSDIVVSVKKYSRYKFLVGEEGQIDGVLEGDVTNVTEKTAFKSINTFEAELLGTIVADGDTGINNGREQIMVDKDEYNELKNRVAKLESKTTMKTLTNSVSNVSFPNGANTTDIVTLTIPEDCYAIIHGWCAIQNDDSQAYKGIMLYRNNQYISGNGKGGMGGEVTETECLPIELSKNDVIKLRASQYTGVAKKINKATLTITYFSK